MTASGTIGSNEVLAAVTAYIDNGNSTTLRPANAQVTSLGAMSVSATDHASINASSEMTSINTPVNDGGAGLINHYADLVLNAYQYTENRAPRPQFRRQGLGRQRRRHRHGVSLDGHAHPGVDLGSLGTGSVSTFAYANLEYWKPLTQEGVTQDTETAVILGVAGAALEKEGLSGSATSLYLLFDFNNVSSSTSSYIVNATTSSASLSVEAFDTASITASDSSVVTAGAAGEGGGSAAGGVLATNHVVGGATADIQYSGVTTTAGDVLVHAENTSTITATEDTVLNSKGKSGTLVAAFNVIG